MKNLIKLTMAALAVMFTITGGNAQTPYQTTGNSEANAGTTALSITVAMSADLRSGGNINAINGATGSGASNNDALNVNLTFADVTPSQAGVSSSGGNRFLRAYVPILLRSNAPYQVKAFLVGAAAGIPAGLGNSGDFKTGDIGFGLRLNETACTPGSAGCLVTSNEVQKDVLANDPAGAGATNNGQTVYAANGSLNFVGVGAGNATTIAHGDRISVRGDNTSANWRRVILGFAIKPQYYTPATFTDTLKVFITTP